MTANQFLKNWDKSFEQADAKLNHKARHSAISVLKRSAFSFYDNETNKEKRREWNTRLHNCSVILNSLSIEINKMEDAKKS